MNRIVLFLILLAVCCTCVGENSPSIYEQANEIYQSGTKDRYKKSYELLFKVTPGNPDYDKSIKLQEEILQAYYYYKTEELSLKYSNSHIAFVDENKSLSIMTLNREIVDTIVPYKKTSSPIFDPCWSHDGRQITFATLNAVFIVNKDGKELTKLTKVSKRDNKPSFSFNDKKIIFADRESIFTLTIETKERTEIDLEGKLKFSPFYPIYLNQANDIIFYSNYRLYSCTETGEMLCEWIDPLLDNKKAFIDRMYIDPVLSYNNKKLAVMHKGMLEIIDVETKQILFTNPIKNYSWSPDNQYLIYSTTQGEIYIYILHPDEDDIPYISWIYICKGKYPAWSPFF